MANEGLNDWVVSGLNPTPPGNTLSLTIPLGVVRIGTTEYSIASDGGHTYTASKDTYVDVTGAGTYTYTAVNNNATAPALTANSIRICCVITDANRIVSSGIRLYGFDNFGVPQSPVKAINIGRDNDWIIHPQTASYETSTSFTLPYDATNLFQPGMPLRWKQGGSVYYGNIVTMPSVTGATTGIHIIGNNDYVIQNTSIAELAYSYSPTPLGFPLWFTWSPTVVGYSSTPTDGIYRYCVVRNIMFVTFNTSQGSTTSNSSTKTFTLPTGVAPSNSMVENCQVGMRVYDNGSYLGAPGMIIFSPGNNVITLTKDGSGAGFTASGGNKLVGQFFFQI